MNLNIPKGVNIIVKSGENLEYSVPGSKKKSSHASSAKTRKWCVVFSGGKKKMATEFVDAQDGCPTWDCEVTIDLVSPADPIIMKVLDGEKRHIGQVVIPLAEIPQTGPPNFDPSKLHYTNLGPTKKNSTPRGRLVYWIWATSYWPAGTKMESKSKSFRGSLSHLSRGSKSKSGRAPSMVSGAYSESNLSGSASYIGDPAGPGAWNNNTDVSRNPSMVGGNLGASRSSYNPLAGIDDEGSVVGSQIRGSDTDEPRPRGLPPIYQSALQLNQAPSEFSTDSTGEKHGKHKSLLHKMKSRFSKSTQNLTQKAASKAGGNLYSGGSVISLRSSKDRTQVPDSATTMGITRPANGSVISFSREGLDTGSNGAGIRRPGRDERAIDGSATTIQPSVSPSPYRPVDTFSGNQAPTEHTNKLPESSPLNSDGGQWGLHAEERGRKPYEEMSRREAIEYAMQLERSLQVTRAELTRLQSEHDELTKKSATDEEDLVSVRTALADLRNRLLADNLTQYLELPQSPGRAASLDEFSTDGYKGINDIRRAASQGGFYSSQQNGGSPPSDGPQSFLAKLSALKLAAGFNSSGGTPPAPATPAQTTDWW
ncbi:unnamed protein product [Calicophoron daubneyi]|uniref:C2 domain-containing protein n=1 Tax=Calicophoron daubneyi TaxID=300641 RepID=A0AAV2SZF1_CALDB